MNTSVGRERGEGSCLVFGCLACLFLGEAWGAQRSKNRVALEDVNFNCLKSPQFRVSPTDSRAKVDGEWFQIMVDYEAEGGKDGWIDELVLEWNVELDLKGSKDILLRRAVTYVDVEGGKCHAAVYIRPALMRRYANNGRRFTKDDVKVYVVARVDGVKSDSAKYPTQGKSKWWENEPPRITLLAGELLTRPETPFAPIDYDFYEHIKPASADK